MTTEPTPAEVRVDRQVRPTLSEALKAYWNEAQRAAQDDYDPDDKWADFALRDVMRAVADLLNAERDAERERCAKLCEERRDRDLIAGNTAHAFAADDCARMIRVA